MAGSSARHGVPLVGPTVDIGVRPLTEFRLREPALEVPGGDGIRIITYEVRPPRLSSATHASLAATMEAR